MIIRSKAPLRLGLAGGGTDLESYYTLFGGSILNATIDMYAYCTIEPVESNIIEFHAEDLDKHESFNPAEKLNTDNHLNLHTGVYNRIIKDFNNGKPLSFKMTTYSDAPSGSGLGSSSTMVVAMIKAYTEWLNLPLGEYDTAALAYEIEREDLGLSGGKQDQYAATFGGFNFMEFFRNNKVIVNPLRLKRWIRNELENSLVLYNTGISRDSAEIIQIQINSTGKEQSKNLENMHKLKYHSVKIKEALLLGNFRLFFDHLTESWKAKKETADPISNPYIDDLYNYVLKNGGEAAKISGAGGGGFMMCFCEPRNRMKLINSLKKREGTILTPSFTEIGTQAWTIYNY